MQVLSIILSLAKVLVAISNICVVHSTLLINITMNEKKKKGKNFNDNEPVIEMALITVIIARMSVIIGDEVEVKKNS